ncbi:uncharacterized protein SPPG_05064 [Spizellomyces punctatus DAOM BR117]|uniref:Cell division control protein 24 OB domain-containing protein n=1 Tax=Spizellomyces punctatus (strain DAOM BR117) TaxID=645134 RepID=A0A0L0HFX0_SPIPD|nr:uncharacterized protein SPPG_05064 [Spizellomyces punctatus DAOM BR117]KNC99683.1 hypothetical protein SPPG_05064 [Spizellomyces punctatus DAOM BR117]|eukprot:XP_016607723.1 hypothetical protein SPPG_05064 [Spizellomyces punctatus DAOM BR117]
MVTLSDPGSRRSIDMYLHQKFCFLADECAGDFLEKHRQVRITGTRSVTTPVGGTRLLPTEHMVFLLSESDDQDKKFLSDRFDESLSHVAAADVEEERSFAFLVKRLHVYVNDTSVEENACLVLWDEQIGLASLFRKGDWLAIWRPYVTVERQAGRDDKRSITLEYGSQTVIFVIPMDPTKEMELMCSMASQPSQHAVPRDAQGILDFKWYPNRLLITELAPKMINITIFGKVLEVIANMPFENEGIKVSRYGIRLTDESGYCDITLWDDIGQAATSNAFVGDWLLLEGLATTERVARGQPGKLVKKRFDVFGKVELGTKAWNVSSSTGFLCSPFLRNIMRVSAALAEKRHNFYCRAVISTWAEGKCGRTTISIHPRCNRPVETTDEAVLYCPFCAQFIEECKVTYTLRFVLDDATGCCEVDVGLGVAEDILAVTPSEFVRLALDEQREVLDAIIGKEIEGSIVRVYDHKDQTISFRLTAACVSGSSVQSTKTLIQNLAG